MAQLIIAAAPTFTDLAEGVLVAGQPLRESAIQALNNNAKFAAVREECVYMGFFKHGATVPVVTSLIDGYVYSRAEIRYKAILVSTQKATGTFTNGQKTMPTFAVVDSDTTKHLQYHSTTNAIGTFYWLTSDVADASGVAALAVSYYIPGGAETITADGIVKVLAYCQRSSTQTITTFAPGSSSAVVGPVNSVKEVKQGGLYSSLLNLILHGILTAISFISLTAGDAYKGRYYAIDFDRWFLWTGVAWLGENYDAGSIHWFATAPTTLGWQLCDGSAGVVRSMPDGTTSTITVPNLIGSYVKATSTYVAPAAAIAPGISGSTAGEAAHTHGIGSIAAANESAHAHGIGSYAAANESSHTHAGHVASASVQTLLTQIADNVSTYVNDLVLHDVSGGGTVSTSAETGHTHGIGSYAAANESAHTHGIGSYVAANESSHTHNSYWPSDDVETFLNTSIAGPVSSYVNGLAIGSTYDDVTLATGTESGHTHAAGSYAGPSHTHTGTWDSGDIPNHYHSLNFTTGAGSAHSHASGTLAGVTESVSCDMVVASEEAAVDVVDCPIAGHFTVSVTSGDTDTESAHTHDLVDGATGIESFASPITHPVTIAASGTAAVTGTSGGGSSHLHKIPAATLAGSLSLTYSLLVLVSPGNISMTVDAGSAHTHVLSGTSGTGSGHTHTLSGSSGESTGHTHTVSLADVSAGIGIEYTLMTMTSLGDIAVVVDAGSAHTHVLSGSSGSGSAHTHVLAGATGAGSSHLHGVGTLAVDSAGRPPTVGLMPYMRL